jgi:tetratricopeptide (TPR) repeat protein
MIHLLHEAAHSPLAEWGAHRITVTLPALSETETEPVTLDLIGSGSYATDYADRVRTFSWDRFFENESGGAILDRWRDEWKKSYDFVLFDSRTGITDIGGVCTILLPDFLALVFSANNQSFEGALAVVGAAQAARRNLGVPRPPLAVLPILSRFDRGDEVAEADQWLKRFSEELKPFYDDWLPKRFEPLQMIELTKVPYVTLFSFGEKLPVLTHGVSEPQLPGYYYRNLARLLESDFRDAASIIDPESVPATRKIYISHSICDDTIVRDLRMALAKHGDLDWIATRELRGVEPLWLEVQHTIEESSAYAVVVSPAAFQSMWVGKELRHALKIRDERGNDQFPVILLSLDGTKLGVLEEFFDEQPIYIPLSSGASGIEAAINSILVALGRRDPVDVLARPQPQAEPLEELVLELSDLKVQDCDGVRRATARARLIYEAATPGLPSVNSDQSWRLIAPLGPIEMDELCWYLEQYTVWPSPYVQSRARQVEENLVRWGQLLHAVAMPESYTANVISAWGKTADQAGSRISIYVDDSLEAGSSEADITNAREASRILLGLPWELLHDGNSFLFQASNPTCVRRRLPNKRTLPVPVVASPIRVLLITARPEDDACGYLDHRASALPLVAATEELGEVLRLSLLHPATYPALEAELARAQQAGEPYHVVHFDGHGIYDRRVGLGGFCFEDPSDSHKLTERRHQTVYTNQLGPLLNNYRIPLVLLEACQIAQAEAGAESVASDLLQRGVASVVAMSHSVLVETARRFVAAFYAELAKGQRVGQAMLAGQRALHSDPSRGQRYGIGELTLADWFVPVLYQEKDDPQLFTATPAPQTQEDLRERLRARLGEVPPEPAESGFVGRSRDLLALERLLRQERWVVVRGQGGEGKTALAAELARWLVRSQQLRRAAFVSVELCSHKDAVLDALGRQLVGADYTAAKYESPEQALLLIERALREQPTLLVIDNMESVLVPPYLETPELLSEEAALELQAILALAERLLRAGETRLVFTSREALPAPFDAQRQRWELRQLEKGDAVALIERSLAAGESSGAPGAGAGEDALEARLEEIEALVAAVQGHALTLALLAPELRRRGVASTQAALVELMEKMEQQVAQLPEDDPRRREQSLFASVEHSLRRLSAASRERARVLGVFHGGVNLDVLRAMTGWEEGEVEGLAVELFATGLATANPYNHLSLNPALCPYLKATLGEEERQALTAAWMEAMAAYLNYLYQQRRQNTELAATLTLLELPNLFALLDCTQSVSVPESTINRANSLYSLLVRLGKPRLLERLARVREAAAAALGVGPSHARFEASRTRIEQQLATGHLREALAGAQQLLQQVQAAGEEAYAGADYDLAMAFVLLGRVLQTGGAAQQALPLLQEAGRRFEAIEHKRPGVGAERMASACLTEQGDCLTALGRYDAAAATYEESIRRSEQGGDLREVAVSRGQLGTIRLKQKRYDEALEAYQQARDTFSRLNEPGTVAIAWHQIGRVHQEAGQPEAAEEAYNQSLAIEVRLGNIVGQSRTLNQLGSLYDEVLGRPEDAVAFCLRAADNYVQIGDTANEGHTRSNLAGTLRKLHRFDEARQEIRRAIECKAQFGHASESWNSWYNLAAIETDAGNAAAAAEAKGKAIACYLAYRRDGGENHNPDGRISLAVTQALRDGDPAQAANLLQQLAADPEAAELLPFIGALQAVVAGSRDPALADQPELDFTMAAEILLLIESLAEEQG